MGFSERPKYRARRTTVHGQTFASKKEAKHYLIYRALEEAGQITDLKTQVGFKIVIKGKLICSYFADFTFLDSKGVYCVVDVKGFRTPVYRIKKKLVEACHLIKIIEV